MGMTAAIIGGATLAGGVASSMIGADAAKGAANTQAQASDRAAMLSQANFQQVRNDLRPYIDAGATALPKLQELTGLNAGGNPLTAPLTARFDPSHLENTPGYKFVLDQGLKASHNSYAANGLGGSGAAMKGAADYAEGLAGTTYQQMFNNYLGENSQIYNMLGGLSGSGQNAAAGLGSLSLNNTASINALTTGGAAAQAAGQIGAANAWGGLNNTVNGLSGMAFSNPGMFGLSSGSGTSGNGLKSSEWGAWSGA